jgi:nitrite reductase (NADH) large subunit
MERQLDGPAAELLKASLEDKGINVCLNASTERISGETSVEALVLTNGRRLPASTVVMAVGVKPRSSLAASAGINCRRGFIVDDHMQTSIANIFAIGECAEHRGQVYGLVEPAYEQARVAARTICGMTDCYSGTILATNLKVSGVPVFSAGDFIGGGSEIITWRDASIGCYRKFVVKGSQLTGVVLVGDTTDALWYRELIRSCDSISAIRSTLAFGRAYAEAA